MNNNITKQGLDFKVDNKKEMTITEFKEIFAQLGCSRRELAKAIRRDERTVGNYLNGTHKIDPPVARHMEEFRDGKPL